MKKGNDLHFKDLEDFFKFAQQQTWFSELKPFLKDLGRALRISSVVEQDMRFKSPLTEEKKKMIDVLDNTYINNEKILKKIKFK